MFQFLLRKAMRAERHRFVKQIDVAHTSAAIISSPAAYPQPEGAVSGPSGSR
jgi:hypothetical protein